MNSGGDFPARSSCGEPGSMTRHQLTRLPSIWMAVLDRTDLWSSPGLTIVSTVAEPLGDAA